jgi:hypothetical protein
VIPSPSMRIGFPLSWVMFFSLGMVSPESPGLVASGTALNNVGEGNPSGRGFESRSLRHHNSIITRGNISHTSLFSGPRPAPSKIICSTPSSSRSSKEGLFPFLKLPVDNIFEKVNFSLNIEISWE